jgi:hypothetical protein
MFLLYVRNLQIWSHVIKYSEKQSMFRDFLFNNAESSVISLFI